MTSPPVSIILPCYNAQETLSEAVSSIVGQTFEDFELILFDDGSTDGSLGISQSLACGDGRIKVVASEHVGIVEALRRACSVSRGKYLARMDADDISHPERIEKQFSLMEREAELGICGAGVKTIGNEVGIGRIRYDDWVNNLTHHDEIMRELFVECPIPHPTFMLRRDVFEAVGGYQERGWAEDYDLCMRLFLHGARFGKVPQVLVEWRDTPERLSMTDDRYSFSRFRELKRHYLLDSYLSSLCGPNSGSGAPGRRFFQWGAGEVGKLWLREWAGLVPEAVVDINPRKVGLKIHGVQVIEMGDLPAPGSVFIVIAVGAPGARDEIRAELESNGYNELTDFVFLA